MLIVAVLIKYLPSPPLFLARGRTAEFIAASPTAVKPLPTKKGEFPKNLPKSLENLMASDAMKKACPDLIRGRKPKAMLVTPRKDSYI